MCNETEENLRDQTGVDVRSIVGLLRGFKCKRQLIFSSDDIITNSPTIALAQARYQ